MLLVIGISPVVGGIRWILRRATFYLHSNGETMPTYTLCSASVSGPRERRIAPAGAMTTQPLNSRRYEILRALRVQDLLLTKTAYAPGPHPRHSHDNARFVFVLKGTFAEGYASTILRILREQKATTVQ